MDIFDINELKSLIYGGESHRVEFKRDFDWNDINKKLRYLKAIVGLHNHEGGYLFFGIDDVGNLLGIGNEFEDIDNADINKAISSFFQPSIHHWVKKTILIESIKVGVIHVEQRKTIPSVCKKDYPKIFSESDIYYRYHSETTRIKYGDLLKILAEISQTEQVQETKRVRIKDIEPYIKFKPHLYSRNEGTFTLLNASENIATIKKLIQINTEGFTFYWRPSQEYGQKLNGGNQIQIRGSSSPMLAHSAPFLIRIIFEDKDGNTYYQEFSKIGETIKETLPVIYEEKSI